MECNTILNFIKHIFGEDYELGLDYIQLLYQRPSQNLPTLFLYSGHQSGKSTFIQFIKYVIGENIRITECERLTKKMDEKFFQKALLFFEEMPPIEFEKLRKNFSPEFKGKFILSSNNDFLPSTVWYNENLYWNINIPTIESGDPLMLSKLKDEIPAFLKYLTERNLTTKMEGQFWFNPELLNKH